MTLQPGSDIARRVDQLAALCVNNVGKGIDAVDVQPELPNVSAWSTQQSDRRLTQVLDSPTRFAEDECKRRQEVRYAKLTDGQGSFADWSNRCLSRRANPTCRSCRQ